MHACPWRKRDAWPVEVRCMEDKDKLQNMLQATLSSDAGRASKLEPTRLVNFFTPQVIEDSKSQLRRSSAEEVDLQSVLDNKAATFVLLDATCTHTDNYWIPPVEGCKPPGSRSMCGSCPPLQHHDLHLQAGAGLGAQN